MSTTYSISKLEELTKPQKVEILGLWNDEYPAQLNHESVDTLETYLNGCRAKKHWLAIDENGTICGWFMSFERNAERWFAMIIHRKHQGKGLGKLLLTKVKLIEPSLNGWAVDEIGYQKQDGTAYNAPLEFYIKHGFTLAPEVRFETEILSSVKIVWSKPD